MSVLCRVGGGLCSVRSVRRRDKICVATGRYVRGVLFTRRRDWVIQGRPFSRQLLQAPPSGARRGQERSRLRFPLRRRKTFQLRLELIAPTCLSVTYMLHTCMGGYKLLLRLFEMIYRLDCMLNRLVLVLEHSECKPVIFFLIKLVFFIIYPNVYPNDASVEKFKKQNKKLKFPP